MKQKKIRVLTTCVSALLAAFALNCGATSNEVPFTDTFEEYAAGTSLVDGTNGWYASATSVVVQTDEKYPSGGSTKAASIPQVETLTNRFQNTSPVTSLWVQMDVRPVLYQGTDHPMVDTNASTVFYVNSNGYFTVLNGGTNWVAAATTDKGDPATVITNGAWVRLHMYQNYTDKTWDLFANYVRIKKNVNFVSNVVSKLNGFELRNGSVTNSYLDNVDVTTNLPADLQADGGDWLPSVVVSTSTVIQTVQEEYDATSQSFQIWKTNGSCDVAYTISVTNTSSMNNWLSVSPSTGTTSGEKDTIQINYDTSALNRGTYTGVIEVAATETDYGFTAKNSPQQIEVVLTVEHPMPVLSRSPTSLIQEIQKGSNGTNMSFEVWNSGYYTLAYVIDDNKAWMACTPGIGWSTGEHDTITVSFDSASLDEGTYSGTITITGQDNEYHDPADGSPKTISVTLRVVVPEGPPAGSISATDGDYTDKIVVQWEPSSNAVSYEIYRGSTFDSSYANRLTDTSSTNYEDSTAEPGVKYYYWVRPKNAYGYSGSFGSYDTGYRALSPPSGIFVSQGSYTNKIRIWWAEADGASSYEVWRNEVNSSNSAVKIKHTPDTSYEDEEVSQGRTYYYWVKAKSSSYASGFGNGSAGYTLTSPTGISASDGAHLSKVTVTWNAVSGATTYEIWRHTMPYMSAASKVGDSYTATFDDTSVSGDTKYYYWVRANSATASSGLGGWDSGYAAYGQSDLQVSEFTFLPRNLGAGSHPAVSSFTLRNGGVQSMASPHTAVTISLFLSSNGTLGDGDDISLGTVSRDIVLASGDSTPVVLTDTERSGLTVPSGLLGVYYVFVKVEHASPSGLIDPSPSTAIASRSSQVSVGDTSVSSAYHVNNDYDGDGRADLAIYDPASGYWYVRGIKGNLIAWGIGWGGPGFEPVFGDYNGDGKADLAVYHETTGKWYIRTVEGSVLAWGTSWGGPGLDPCFGDYDGDGSTDLGVYLESAGKRYIWSLSQGMLLWGVNWGAPGFQSVPGDYNGSGACDLAAYQAGTGNWYVRSVTGDLIAWATHWGGGDLSPVFGDYDGDGHTDLAVYHRPSGGWYIQSLTRGTITWGDAWGGPTYTPVSGDFDGDGINDFAVFDETTGYWYIKSANGSILAWGVQWGAPGMQAVGSPD